VFRRTKKLVGEWLKIGPGKAFKLHFYAKINKNQLKVD
jgi:hypothetical protein